MKLTFDEAPSSPFNLRSDDYTCTCMASPCYTCPSLYAENVATWYVWSTCSGEGRSVILKVGVDDLVSELAFSLSGSDAAV